MAKHPNEPTTGIVVPVEFVQDPDSREWILTSLQTPRISARHVDIRRARRQLATELSEKLGKPVTIRERIKLPKELADRVAQHRHYRAEAARYAALAEEDVLPLTKLLMVERLQQQQIADLLGISTQWLGQQLKLDATGTHTRTKR